MQNTKIAVKKELYICLKAEVTLITYRPGCHIGYAPAVDTHSGYSPRISKYDPHVVRIEEKNSENEQKETRNLAGLRDLW